MSEQNQSELKCAICNEIIEGELSKNNYRTKDFDISLGDIQNGCQCNNCSAYICFPTSKHIGMGGLKFGLFGGWKKALCPVCGNELFPGKIIINRASKYVDPKTKKRLRQTYEYLRAENLMNNSKKRSVVETTLQDISLEVFDDILSRIENNPSYDATRQCSNILALSRTV